MSVHIVEETISVADVKAAAEDSFGTMVKAMVDVENRIMAIGGELHADANAALIEHGSRPQDLWGINIYPDKSETRGSSSSRSSTSGRQSAIDQWRSKTPLFDSGYERS